MERTPCLPDISLPAAPTRSQIQLHPRPIPTMMIRCCARMRVGYVHAEEEPRRAQILAATPPGPSILQVLLGRLDPWRGGKPEPHPCLDTPHRTLKTVWKRSNISPCKWGEGNGVNANFSRISNAGPINRLRRAEEFLMKITLTSSEYRHQETVIPTFGPSEGQYGTASYPPILHHNLQRVFAVQSRDPKSPPG